MLQTCQSCGAQTPALLDCDGWMVCGVCFDKPKSSEELWPNQSRALAEFVSSVDAGERQIAVTGPTGSGKTRLMAELAKWARERRWPVALYTNRKLLTSQADKTLDERRVEHGVMAANYEARLMREVQVCSLQTIDFRVFGTRRWELPRAKLVMIDEAHSNKGDVGEAVIAHYLKEGAVVSGFTATPVGIGHLYRKLIVAGTKAECRRIGSLVPCYVVCPNEPFIKGVRKREIGETAAGKKLWQTIVHANVFKHWRELNPQGLPTILWAPGVPESKWFVRGFQELGVTAAHVDGSTKDEERERVFKDSREGRCQVICSMGVMREGVDLPWLCHGILCQPCINYSTYVQIVGRLLRAYDGKTSCVLQDHAGAFWRHGSPNEDREWKLEDTDQAIAAERKRKIEAGELREPIRCPECGAIRMTGPKCWKCGYEHVRSVRAVIMTDGTLVRKVGSVRKKRRQVSEDERVWISCLYAAAKGRQVRSLQQARVMFRRRTGHDLPDGIKFRPPDSSQQWGVVVDKVFPWLNRKRDASGQAKA